MVLYQLQLCKNQLSVFFIKVYLYGVNSCNRLVLFRTLPPTSEKFFDRTDHWTKIPLYLGIIGTLRRRIIAEIISHWFSFWNEDRHFYGPH